MTLAESAIKEGMNIRFVGREEKSRKRWKETRVGEALEEEGDQILEAVSTGGKKRFNTKKGPKERQEKKSVVRQVALEEPNEGNLDTKKRLLLQMSKKLRGEKGN